MQQMSGATPRQQIWMFCARYVRLISRSLRIPVWRCPPRSSPPVPRCSSRSFIDLRRCAVEVPRPETRCPRFRLSSQTNTHRCHGSSQRTREDILFLHTRFNNQPTCRSARRSGLIVNTHTLGDYTIHPCMTNHPSHPKNLTHNNHIAV